MSVDDFIARSRELNGQELREREIWNSRATADAIRHFAYGISDDNPLWLDPAYAAGSRYGRLVAPPAFLASVLYPVLHGAPVAAPLSNLIGELEFEWLQPVLEGDELRAAARQTGVRDVTGQDGRRSVHILSETTYWRGRDEVVARARCTLVRRLQEGNELLLDRPAHRYTEQERERIRQALEREERRGATPLRAADVSDGLRIPPLIRGPLTIGDLICWQAAAGPSYRAGALGYRDAAAAPHTAVINPVTGWPVKNSQQHEDFQLASQRGMPAPFDNGVMRFAWMTPLLTNWMGDNGFLRRFGIQLLAPNLYGDTTTYEAVVTSKREDVACLKVTGTNQLGQTTTAGKAEIIIEPRREIVQGAATLPADLFERKVRETPHRTALIDNGREWTYAELNRRANRLARYLRSRGARPGTLVGIRLPRSSDFVIAILAALKTGAGYVPLDPGYPPERLKLMVAKSRPALMIDGEVSLPSDDNDIAVRREADAPAYVMFTSGSTAEPKGVLVSHGTLASYLQAIREPLGIQSGDICLHTASFSFSASVRQTLLPLSVGAALVVARETERLDPLALLRLMKERAVTVWDTVPSVWRNAVAVLERLPEGVKSELLDSRLRQIQLTGEALPWELPRMWRSGLGHAARILNLYSQTETAGTAAIYPLPDGDLPREGIVPLGYPTPDTKIQLREDGEICVTGRIADGYIDGERFEEYRTGDLGRLRGGVLEFAGRVDSRLKVRGFRVEPREVETALRAHPAVADAAVTGRKDASEQTQLTAYVVPAGFGSRKSHRLPNGLRVAHQNRHETEFTYRHIFEDQTYLRYGITFRDGDTIFDVGANIGLFSIFAGLLCHQPRLYCFEPNPGAHEALRENVERFRLDARLFSCALASRAGVEEFTVFPGFSILSGRYADPDSEKDLIRRYMDNQPGIAPPTEHTGQILDARLRPETIQVRQDTLSGVLQRTGVDRIHLLKINAEKSEVDILHGIEDSDWQRIDQIVIKADHMANLPVLGKLLEENGYDFVVHQEAVLKGTELHSIYAVRRSSDRTLRPGQRGQEHVRTIPGLGRLLQRFLGESLPDYMIPARFEFVSELPRTLSGKLSVRELPPPPEPRGSVEETIAAVWRDVLEVNEVHGDDDFFELGGNSMTAVESISRLNQALGTDLPLAVLFEAPTPRRLAGRVSGASRPRNTVSLVPIQPSGSQPPLFCVHAIEGDVLFYRDLAQRLGPDQPVYGLQAPGLDGARRPALTIPELASRYIDEIGTVRPRGPWRLGGFCFGAYVALEMAVELESQGEDVELLFNFNTDGEWRTVSSFREAVRYHWRYFSAHRGRASMAYLLGRLRFRFLRARDWIAATAAELISRNGRTIPAPLRKPYVRECNFQASRSYRPREFSGRLVFFQGENDRFHDPEPFWGPLVRDGIDVHSVPGKEMEVLREPNVAALAERLQRLLQKTPSIYKTQPAASD